MAKAMRRPNGYGTIVKRQGRRRNPYEIRITQGFEMYIDEGNVKTRQKQVSIGSYPDYQTAALELALYNNNPYDAALRNVTFEQAYQVMIKQKADLAKSTLDKYRIAFTKVAKLHNKQLVKIKHRDLQSLVDAEPTEPTQQQIITLFNTIFSWASDISLIKESPAKNLNITASKKEQREGQPYTKDEIKLLWHNLYRMNGIDMILVQIYTGLRILELLAIKKEHVHLDERWIFIEGTKTENAERKVPIRKEIIPLLKKRMENDTEFVFCNKSKTSFLPKTSYMRTVFEPIRTNLNMQHHVTHDARHTFISSANDSGINHTALKMIVGHALQGVTEKSYTHKDIENLIIELDKIYFL